MPSFRLSKVSKPHLSEKVLSERLMKALTGDTTKKGLGPLLLNERFAKAFATEFKKQLKPHLKTVTKEERKALKRFLKVLKQPHQALARQHAQEMLNLLFQRKSLLRKALPYILSAGAGAAAAGGVMMALQSKQNDQVPFQHYQ